MEFEGFTFTPFTREDIPVFTPIMKRAFDEDSRMYFQHPVGGPPGYDDGSFLQKWGVESGANAYRIDRDGDPVGVIILFINREKHAGFLGCLFVDAARARQGIGHAAWRFAEASFPDITVWETETPAVSYRNHCFYVNRCGFQVYAVEGGDDRYEAQFKLRKIIRK